MTTSKKRTPLHQQTMPVVVEAIARILVQYDLSTRQEFHGLDPEGMQLQMIAERILHAPQDDKQIVTSTNARRAAMGVHRMLIARNMIR